MVITVELNKNNWLLQLEGKKNDRDFVKRYRDKESIKSFFKDLDSPTKVYVGINDMKLYYDDCTIVLKDYRKNKNRYLYKNIVNKFDENIKIENILSSNMSKLPQFLKTKKGILTVALSATLIGSMIPQQTVNADAVVDTNISSYGISTSIINSGTSTYTSKTTINNPTQDMQVSYFDPEENMDLDDRILQVENIQNSDNNINFNLCGKLDEYTFNRMVKYMEKNESVFKEASLKYGVDPYLLLSISMTESSLLHSQTIPGGKYYNKSAIGAMQIENVHLGSVVTAFNYQTEVYDSITLTQNNLCDFKTNVEVGAMMLQNHLEKYNNNVYITIQAHNYGTNAMDKILQLYATETGKTVEQITKNTTDFGWMKYVDDVYNNPKKYFPKWSEKTYGNNCYIESVLGYYMGEQLINRCDDDYYVYDLINNTMEIQNPNNNILISNSTLNRIEKQLEERQEEVRNSYSR